jgi:aldose 1-epimerase
MTISLSRVRAMALLLFIACACTDDKPLTTVSGLHPKDFQTIIGGKKVDLYVLRNKGGMEVCITNYGCRIVSVMVPDRKGKFRDVALGFDSISDYLRYPSDMGATVGRYTGIVRNAKISIGGKTFHLSQDDAGNYVSGGEKSFQNQVFDAQQISDSKVVLTYISKNGEEGFPGNLICSATFKLEDDNALNISYTMDTDCPTAFNVTNHLYLNLSGNPSTLITDNRLMIRAPYFVPVSSALIPTGKVARVSGTPMDFRKPRTIGKYLNQGNYLQIKNAKGFDHTYLIQKDNSDSLYSFAELFSPESGIMMSLNTTEPCLHLYSGNRMSGTMTGKHGAVYNQHAALVLSAGKIPLSVKGSHASSILEPGKKYTSRTVLKFSAVK